MIYVHTFRLPLIIALWLGCFLPLLAEAAPARLLLLRGGIALAEGDGEAAAADLHPAADLLPERWEIQTLYGRALLLSGDREQAVAQFRRAAILAPTTLQSWQTLAHIAHEIGDPQLELNADDELQRFFPDDPLLQQRMAGVLRAVNQPLLANRAEAAWRAYLPLLKLDTHYPYHKRYASRSELQTLAHADTPDADAIAALAAMDWEAGKLDAAAEGWKRAHELSPRDVTVIGNYAYACLVTNHIDDALHALLAAAPLGEYTLDRALGLWSISTGHYADAAAAFQRLRTRDPMDYSINVHLGVAALQAGDVATAVNILRIAWLTTHAGLAAQHYAVALAAAGRQKEAVELLKTASELWPNDDFLALELAAYYQEMGRQPESAELLAGLAKRRPDAVALLLVAGDRYLHAGYVSRVNDIAVRLRDDYPASLTAMRGAAALFRRLDQPAEARLVFTRYLGPQVKTTIPRTDLMLEIARNAVEIHQFSEANTALRNLLKTEPSRREVFRMLEALDTQQAQWAEALRLDTQALEHWPKDPFFLLARAQAARQIGDTVQAVAQYQQALALTPTADTWLALADLYAGSRDVAQARGAWQKAAELAGGALRARFRLLASYTSAGETPPAECTTDSLRTLLATERDAHTARWTKELATIGLTATPEEMDALLLMARELLDPAALK